MEIGDARPGQHLSHLLTELQSLSWQTDSGSSLEAATPLGWALSG